MASNPQQITQEHILFNFCIRYLNNTLPTLKNMVLWKKSENALCKVCYNTQTLQHVVSACKVHLEEGRYTWRHNSVLKIIADYLLSITNNIELYCDITRYMSPSIITGEQKVLISWLQYRQTTELSICFGINCRF